MKTRVGRTILSAAAACVIVGWVAGPASAAPGDLDQTFSGDGQVATKFPENGAYAYDVLALSDGSVIVAGDAFHTADDVEWALAKYRPNGTLDPDFGTGGKVETNLSGNFDAPYAIARAGNGKFYVGGYTGTSFAVARYLPDGHLDHSFSGDGKAIVSFASGDAFGYDMSTAPGGKVVLVGEVDNGEGVGRFAVLRLTKTGAPDHTFSGDGKAITDVGPNSYAYAVAVLKSGAIIAVGDGNTTAHTSPALVKYMPEGTLASGFGDGGIEVDEVGEDLSPDDAVVLAGGKILVEGAYRTSPSTFKIGVVRFQSGGHPDEAFGPNGLVTREFGGTSEYPQRAVVSGQRLLIADGHYEGGDYHMALIRLTMNGAADTAFGDQGLALADMPHTNGDGVAIDPNGRIVVAGNVGITDDTSRFFVARFLAS